MNFVFWALTLSIFPALALADLTLTPPDSDLSYQYLSYVFGVVNGVLHGSGTQIFGTMFGVFNSATLALGGIIITYTFMVSTINTAAEGEIMGKKWSSIWIPLRSAAGIALLLPKGTGYCTIQVFMMWVVVQGIGAADNIWNAVLKYISKGGVVIQQSAASNTTAATPGNQLNLMNFTGNLFQNILCLQVYQSYINQQTNTTPPDLFSLVSLQIAYLSGGVAKGEYSGMNITIDLPWGTNATGYQTPHPPFPATPVLNNLCGSIQINIPGGGSNIELGQAYLIALQQMISDFQTPTMLIQSSYVNNNLPSNIGFTCTTEGASNNIMAGATCSTAVSALTLPASLLQNAISDYQGIIYAAQNLGYVNDGHSYDSNQINSQDLVNQAGSRGWLMAGVYYFNIALANVTQANHFSNLNSFPYSFPTQMSISNINPNIFSNNTASAAVYQYINGGMSYTLSNGNVSGMNADSAGFFAGMVIGTIGALVSIGLASGPGILYILPLFTGLINIFVGFGELLNAQANNFNPIGALAIMGSGLMNAAALFIFAGALVSFLMTFMLSAVPCVSLGSAWLSMVAWLAPLLSGIITLMFSTGAILVYYVPMIPFLLFTFGSLGWLIMVFEAMVAAPLVALGIAYPEEHEVFGKSNHAIVLIANVFLKPSLMLFGFIGGISLSYVSIWILNQGFIYAFFHTVMASFSQQGSWGGAFTAIFGFTAIVLMPLAAMVLYTVAAVVMIHKSFSLIHIVPERVLKWIGGNIEGGIEGQMEQESRQGAQKAADEGGRAAGTAASQAGKYAEKKSDEAKEQGKSDMKASGKDSGGASVGLQPASKGAGGGGGSAGGGAGGAPPPAAPL